MKNNLTNIEKTVENICNEDVFDVFNLHALEIDTDGTKFRWSDGVFKIKPKKFIKNMCIHFTSVFTHPLIVFIESDIKNLKTELNLNEGRDYLLYIPIFDKEKFTFFTKSFIPSSNGDIRNLGIRIKNIFESNLDNDYIKLYNFEDIDIDKIKIDHEFDNKFYLTEMSIEQQNSTSTILPLNYSKNNFYFNSSIFDFNEKRYIITRNCKHVIKNVSINELNLFDLNTLEKIELKIENEFDDEQFEDPRVFVYDDKLYVICANYIYGERFLIQQKVFVFDKKFNQIDKINIKYGKNGKSIKESLGQEKNWTFFPYGKNLMFVYKIDPHVVVEIDYKGNVISEYITHFDTNSIWKYGECRGGSNPILKDGYYYSFFHSSIPWSAYRKRYFMGYYKFESKPPFGIVEISEKPLLWGNEIDERILENVNPIVVFPCGSIVENDEFIVSFGLNDEKTGLVKFKL